MHYDREIHVVSCIYGYVGYTCTMIEEYMLLVVSMVMLATCTMIEEYMLLVVSMVMLVIHAL